MIELKLGWLNTFFLIYKKQVFFYTTPYVYKKKGRTKLYTKLPYDTV